MFDIGWDEILLIGAVALVVIGPKDLPLALRTVGKWTRKAKLLAGEFHRTVDDMVREAELDDVRRQVEQVGRTDFKSQAEKLIDPTGEMQSHLEIREAASYKPPAINQPTAADPVATAAPEPAKKEQDKTP